MCNPDALRLPRSIVALVLLGLVAAVCIALGFWQLDRAQLRRDLQHTIAQGRASSAVQLTPATPLAHLQDWRAAQAQGTWRHDVTVLLENRNQDGRPGYWVATPLMFDGVDDGDGCACTQGLCIPDAAVGDPVADGASVPGLSAKFPAAVLVLRGWLPRRFDTTLPTVPAPTGVQRIHGQLLSHVPRIYELPSLWGKPRKAPHDGLTEARVMPVVTNLTVMEAARMAGLTLLPVVLQQLSDADAPSDGLVRQWAGPALDADKNVGYAVQWFSFAAIALCAALGVAWRTWRRLVLRRKHHG